MHILDDLRMNSRYLGYTLSSKSTAFIPSIIGMILFILLIVCYGRYPASKVSPRLVGAVVRAFALNAGGRWIESSSTLAFRKNLPYDIIFQFRINIKARLVSQKFSLKYLFLA